MITEYHRRQNNNDSKRKIIETSKTRHMKIQIVTYQTQESVRRYHSDHINWGSKQFYDI